MYSDAEIQQQNIAYFPSPETCLHHVEMTNIYESSFLFTPRFFKVHISRFGEHSPEPLFTCHYADDDEAGFMPFCFEPVASHPTPDIVYTVSLVGST